MANIVARVLLLPLLATLTACPATDDESTATDAAVADASTPSRDAGDSHVPQQAPDDAGKASTAWTDGGSCGLRPQDAPFLNFTGNDDGNELCNDWDDDCDDVIDEGFDKDGDGYSTCETAELDVDCDPVRDFVHQGHAELCDGFDNDCDGKWDEGAGDDCPTPRCSIKETCPNDLVCLVEGEACVEAAECADVEVSEVTCDRPSAPEWWRPDPCEPTQCGRWQNGTCWGTCECAGDGMYRWNVGCTE